MGRNDKQSVVLMVLTGFFIGVAAIAPGISGGAIAVIFGLYEPITEAVATIWKDFHKKMMFLAPLGIGAAVGMLLFGKLILFLFSEYYAFTCSAFVGLIAGTLPAVFRNASKTGFRLRYLLATVACGVAILWVTSLKALHYTGGMTELPYWLTLVCGGILGLGSVLPGTSFSFVLMAMGVYQPMLNALNRFDVVRLLLLGIGFCAMFVLFARLLNWLFKKAHGWMSFAVIGMLIGSVLSIAPIPSRGWEGALMFGLGMIGALVSYVSLRIKE